jgi:hypothetical protein
MVTRHKRNKEMKMNKKSVVGLVMLIAVGSLQADVLFEDDFSGSGAPSAPWQTYTWSNGSPPVQAGGNLVTDAGANTGVSRAQTTNRTMVVSDWSEGITYTAVLADRGTVANGKAVMSDTAFTVCENVTPETAWYNQSVQGLYLTLFNDVQSTDRTTIRIYRKGTGDSTSQRGVLMGSAVIGATSDITMSVHLDETNYEISFAGGALFSATGTTGAHNFDFDTKWVNGSSVRLEAMQQGTGDFGPAEWDSVSVTAIPEPLTLGLIGVSLMGILGYRRIFN